MGRMSPPPRPAAKPRILFVGNRILGWNTYSRQLAARLAARDDIEAHVLWRRPHPLATALVKRHDVTPAARRYRRISPVAAYRGYLGLSIRRALRDLRPDVVHFAAHWPAAAIAWRDAAPPFTVATDCTMPDMARALQDDLWHPDEISAEGALFVRAAHVFAMSGWTARSLTGDFAVPDRRITVQPPALDLSGFAPHRGGTGLANLIFIGNDFRRKGGDRLMRWIGGPLAGRCHLHIVSTDDAARIDAPGVTWHGRVEHGALLRDLLPRMDILCLPTRLDMSPHVLVEAAAAGIPAVASDLGGVSDIVRHGRTGLLVRPRDDRGFLDAIRALIAAPEARAAMGRSARAHAAAHFDAARNFDRLIDRLAAIAGGGAAVAAEQEQRLG